MDFKYFSTLAKIETAPAQRFEDENFVEIDDVIQGRYIKPIQGLAPLVEFYQNDVLEDQKMIEILRNDLSAAQQILQHAIDENQQLYEKMLRLQEEKVKLASSIGLTENPRFLEPQHDLHILKEENNVLNQHMEEFRRGLKLKQQRITDLKTALQREDEETKNLQETTEEYARNLQILSNEQQNLRRDLYNKERKRRDLDNKLEKEQLLETHSMESKSKIDDSCDQLNKHNTDLNQKIENSLYQIADLLIMIEKLQREGENQTKREVFVTENIKEVTEINKQIDQHIKQLKNNVSDQNTFLLEAMSTMEEQRLIHKRLRDQTDLLQEKKQRLTAEHESLMIIVEDKVKQAKQETQRQWEKERQDCIEVEKSLNNVGKENSTLIQQIEDLKNEYQQNSERLNELKDTNINVLNLDCQRDLAQKVINKQTREIFDLKQMIDTYSNEEFDVNAIQDKNSMLQKQCDELQSIITKIEDQTVDWRVDQKAKQRLEALKLERDLLEKQLELFGDQTIKIK